MDELNASVTKRIYSGMGHTINEDEINFIRSVV
jgi:predicted esterase